MTAITIYNISIDQVLYHLQRKLQKLYVRLHVYWDFALSLGIVSLLITDVVGHVLNRKSFVNIIFSKYCGRIKFH